MRVAEVRHGRSQPAGPTDPPVFGLEAEFVDDVIVAFPVIVDVDFVQNVIVKVVVIGPTRIVLDRAATDAGAASRKAPGLAHMVQYADLTRISEGSGSRWCPAFGPDDTNSRSAASN